MNKLTDISLNISTYNWPQALELCLKSVLNQSQLPAEVIIADDGSTAETTELIQRFQKDFPVPLVHVWQPDEGFQLARIRNKGIAASKGSYIIQVDGDLILHPHFIRDHARFAAPGTFVTGSRVVLNPQLSARLLQSGSVKLSLFTGGMSNRSNGIRNLWLRNYMASRYRINDIYFMRGCNMAFWRNDLVTVNGYNEDFSGWGREDNEVAIRLLNIGLQKRVIKFGGVVYHIYHPEKSRSGLNRNDELLQDAVKNKTVYCPNGLNQYL
ncbi:glycosyltransferase family 2 protein [Mucilaginibacter koreensis]